VVVAYTDGASEAADPQGNQLGIRGVEAFIRQAADTLDVPPREWPNRLLRGVTAHRQAPPRDDTLLVALYRPTAETSGTR
jgi:serine phosphatase RsbU (regulator of sigma subunit)